MSNTERIEKEANIYADITAKNPSNTLRSQLQQFAKQDYIAGATAERERIKKEIQSVWQDMNANNSIYAPRMNKLIDSL
jgi:hypothetical protein